MMKGHKCAAHGCPDIIPRSQLMCRTHWYQVPVQLRRAINATWKAREMQAWLANVREAERIVKGSD